MTKGKSTPKRKSGTRAKYIPANLVDNDPATEKTGEPWYGRSEERTRGRDGRVRVRFG